MSEFRTIRELCSVVVDCPHSTPKWTANGKIVIRNKNIKHGKIDFSSPSYTDDEHFAQRIKRAKPQPGDIIITREAPIGDVGMIPENTECCLGQRMVLLRANQSVCDNFYLLYSLQSLYVQHQISWSEGTGTTVSNLRIPHLEQIQIPYLPLEQQAKISSVLRALEEKIENNRRLNDNLQQQAAALFESWFVNYDPWDGVQPSEWKNAPLGSFVEIKRGGSPRPIQDFLSDSGLRWLKISDVTSLSSPFVLEIKEHIKEEGLRKTVFLHAGELVLSNSATPGIPKILDVDTCIHDGWLYFPKSELSKYYLYLFFKHIRKELVALGNGSVFTNLKTDILKAFPATKADESALKEFDALVTPLFDAMLNADRENFKLAAMRDALLPKLMSSEIDVSEVEL